jgi:hypothetical protein
MWDDTSAQWDNSSPLFIQGHSIAIKYWPDVYRYWKGRQWEGTKARWTEWKVSILPPRCARRSV